MVLAIGVSLTRRSVNANDWRSIRRESLDETGVLNAVTLPALLVLLHAAASCAMAGVLWIVQLVVYPAFAIVPVDTLPTYAVAHARRITPIVAPLMLVEAVTFVALVAMKVEMPAWLVIAGGLTLVANWVSTFLWQVPLHGRIQRGDVDAIAKLVRSNWLRTLCWSGHAAIGMMMVWLVLSRSAIVAG